MFEFRVIVDLMPIGEYKTFPKAFKKLTSAIRKNKTSIEEVGALYFIIHSVLTASGLHICYMNFFQARDFAWDVGLMKKLEVKKENLLSRNTEKSQRIVDLAFLKALTENAFRAVDDIPTLEKQIKDMAEDEIERMAKKSNIKL